MLLGSTRRNHFDNEKYLDKEVYVLSFENNDIETDYDVFDNLEEAKELFDNLVRANQNKNCSYTLSKCIVKLDELDLIKEIERG